jgi:hypothetical protein
MNDITKKLELVKSQFKIPDGVELLDAYQNYQSIFKPNDVRSSHIVLRVHGVKVDVAQFHHSDFDGLFSVRIFIEPYDEIDLVAHEELWDYLEKFTSPQRAMVVYE